MTCRSTRWLLLVAAVILVPLPVGAQEERSPHRSTRPEGELDSFINPISDDVPTKLTLLQHAIYDLEQKLTHLMFVQQHGESVSFEKVWFGNYDGDITPGFVAGPRAIEPGRRYPAIVMVHGGFHGRLDESDFDTLRRAVEEGYVVIFPEYRGSRGYGKNHYDAIDYGGKEVDDVLAAADYLAARRDYVDPDRIAVMGRSHGGMIALLAAQRAPKRFRAAVSDVGIADLLAWMEYKPEYRRQDMARQPMFGGALPEEDPTPYMDVSPINHVEALEIPVLVLATTGDRIVPSGVHAEPLAERLRAAGNDFEFHLYDRAPGGHLYAYADTPESRDSKDRVFDFFRRHVAPRSAPPPAREGH
jgi:dipeptidyl aminopeptidase/acylaminoacyl peptidase